MADRWKGPEGIATSQARSRCSETPDKRHCLALQRGQEPRSAARAKSETAGAAQWRWIGIARSTLAPSGLSLLLRFARAAAPSTNKAVAEELEIDKAAASRRVRTAIGRGYLKNMEDRRGHPARLVLAESMPEDQEILPAPEELEGVDPLTVDLGGIQYPPPPSEAEMGGGGSNTSLETASTGQRSREREKIIL
jgi:DNA-binding MarR family transcriptional regulator